MKPKKNRSFNAAEWGASASFETVSQPVQSSALKGLARHANAAQLLGLNFLALVLVVSANWISAALLQFDHVLLFSCELGFLLAAWWLNRFHLLLGVLSGVAVSAILEQQTFHALTLHLSTLVLQLILIVLILKVSLKPRLIVRKIPAFWLFLALMLFIVGPFGVGCNFLFTHVWPELALVEQTSSTGTLHQVGYVLLLETLAQTLGVMLLGMGTLALLYDWRFRSYSKDFFLPVLSVILLAAFIEITNRTDIQHITGIQLFLDGIPYLLIPAFAVVLGLLYSPRVMCWLLIAFCIITVRDATYHSLNFPIARDDQALLLVGYIFVYVAVALMASILNAGHVYARENSAYNEQRYRALVENAPEAILVVDLDHGNIIEVNAPAEKLFGYTRSELLSLLIDHLSSDDAEQMIRFDTQEKKSVRHGIRAAYDYLNKNQITAIDWRIRHQSGEFIPAELRIAELPTRTGHLVRISFVDIRERQRLQQAQSKLQAEKLALMEFQQLQMNLMPIACLIADPDFRFTYWNPAAEKMFGYSNSEIIGKTAYETIVPDSQHDLVEKRRQKLLLAAQSTVNAQPLDARQDAVVGVNSNLRKDRSEILCEWYNALLRNGRGEPVGYLSMAVDVTQRMRYEVAMRESEERYRSMAENSVEGVAIERDGELTYVNPAFVKLVKAVNKEELVGRMLVNLFTPEYREGLRTWLLRAELNQEQGEFIERRLLCLDGSTADVEMSGVPIYIDGVRYGQIHIRDITARKWTEREILRMNADLEQRVLERTSELREANRELEAFSYSVAHDLRSPLRAIAGFSGILLEDQALMLNSETRTYLQRISLNADRMAELIEDLLTFAQVGRAQPQMVPIDLNEMVESICIELAEQYPSSRYTIQHLPMVLGDRALLRQLFTNLIGNAFKFSAKQEQPFIEVGVVQRAGESFFFVRDNGVGFDPAYADKLFGVFQRLHGMQEFEGTGVGLAIVHRILQRHGGKILAESQVNQGATFYFQLPLAAVMTG